MAWSEGSGVVYVQRVDPVADSEPYPARTRDDLRRLPQMGIAVEVQGITFHADHIGLMLDGALGDELLVVGTWNDDREDWPWLSPGAGFGWLYTFDAIGPDGEPRQTVTRYGDDADLEAGLDTDERLVRQFLDDPERQPWAAFPRFDSVVHGIWVTDEHMDALNAARTTHGVYDPVWAVTP